MYKNVWPQYLFHNPYSEKSIEEIWDDIDDYSFEEMYSQKDKLESFDFVIPLPPLQYRGKFIKGIFYSQAVDLIVQRFPKIKKLFFPIANSMFSSYPHSKFADCYFTCYKNPKREEHYKLKYPNKKNTVMLPLQDADFTNEYYIAPTFNTPKTIDVFCVSTVYPVKNVPVIAKALKVYEQKYNKVLKVVYAIGNRALKVHEDKSIDYSGLRFDAQDQLRQVEEILGDVGKYIEFHPYIEYKDLSKYYTGAKCCVLASLLEGKNRFLSEAMSCDTPVIVFKDFNKYSRGDYPIFFENSGEYVPEYTPESLADTIHKVINNQNLYEPRKNYLKYSGRKNFVNTCVDSIPYYRENLPDYKEGQVHNNIWVDLATQHQYQISYIDFLYGKNHLILYIRGLKNIANIIDFFFKRFGVK